MLRKSIAIASLALAMSAPGICAEGVSVADLLQGGDPGHSPWLSSRRFTVQEFDELLTYQQLMESNRIKAYQAAGLEPVDMAIRLVWGQFSAPTPRNEPLPAWLKLVADEYRWICADAAPLGEQIKCYVMNLKASEIKTLAARASSDAAREVAQRYYGTSDLKEALKLQNQNRSMRGLSKEFNK